jgi:acetyl esterase/lipase
MLRQQEGRVTVERDVVFGMGGGRELRCNVYRPPEPAKDMASVLLVHGGGWSQGDRTQLHGYGILLGRLGILCVASEYRLSGEAAWPAQIHDVKAALRWMRANAGALGIDPAKIAVSGNSAGGHLSLMLAGTPGVAEFEGEGGNPGQPTDVAACVAFYAPAILWTGGDLPEATAGLMGADRSEQRLRAASPITYARAGFPPTMLMHSNRDLLVPHEASLRMYRALDEAGVPVELHLFDNAPHGFDAAPDLGRQCAQLIAMFLERHVIAPAPPANAEPAPA